MNILFEQIISNKNSNFDVFKELVPDTPEGIEFISIWSNFF